MEFIACSWLIYWVFWNFINLFGVFWVVWRFISIICKDKMIVGFSYVFQRFFPAFFGVDKNFLIYFKKLFIFIYLFGLISVHSRFQLIILRVSCGIWKCKWIIFGSYESFLEFMACAWLIYEVFGIWLIFLGSFGWFIDLFRSFSKIVVIVVFS